MSMHTTELKDQKQLPNPTLINAFGKAPSDDYSSNKLVVFTAFKSASWSWLLAALVAEPPSSSSLVSLSCAVSVRARQPSWYLTSFKNRMPSV